MSGEAPLEWPADLNAVFAAIGQAMGGGRLNPEVLKRVPTGRGVVVPGHQVRLIHGPKGTAARYVIEVDGDRWDCARWFFRSGQLEELARATCRLGSDLPTAR